MFLNVMFRCINYLCYYINYKKLYEKYPSLKKKICFSAKISDFCENKSKTVTYFNIKEKF